MVTLRKDEKKMGKIQVEEMCQVTWKYRWCQRSRDSPSEAVFWSVGMFWECTQEQGLRYSPTPVLLCLRSVGYPVDCPLHVACFSGAHPGQVFSYIYRVHPYM